VKTFVEERPFPDNPAKKGRVTVDDAFEAVVELENGAIGTLEASRFATGRKNYNNFEVNGGKGLDRVQFGKAERAQGILEGVGG